MNCVSCFDNSFFIVHSLTQNNLRQNYEYCLDIQWGSGSKSSLLPTMQNNNMENLEQYSIKQFLAVLLGAQKTDWFHITSKETVVAEMFILVLQTNRKRQCQRKFCNHSLQM